MSNDNPYQGTTFVERKILQDVGPKTKDDEEIMKFLEETKQKIYVIGAGGSGTNTVDRLFELGTEGVQLVGMNTDAKHLLRVRSNKKLIIGKKL